VTCSRVLALGCTVVFAATLLVPVTFGALAGASTASLCQRVSSNEVATTLGMKIAKVTKVVNGDVTVCWYQIGTLSHAAFIRVQTNDNLSGFIADQKLAKTYSENPKVDINFKPHRAFSTTLGSASYGYTYSVEVLKNSTIVDVGAAKVTLDKVEGLAKKVLAIS
jgi:hypothetical protein